MSRYGNVPDDDMAAMGGAVRAATSIVTALPAFAPGTWRDVAYEAVLRGILEDWVANGTTELDENDEQDLANLLKCSADISLAQDPALRDVTFKTLVRAAMSDWVQNWNADE